MTMSHATKTRSVPSILPSHAAQIHVQPPSGTSDVDIYPLTNYTFGEGLECTRDPGPLDTLAHWIPLDTPDEIHK